MRYRIVSVVTVFVFSLAMFAQGPSSSANTGDPLTQILVNRGVITAEEARAIMSAGPPAAQRDRLAALLRDKGLISNDDLRAVSQASVTQNEPVQKAQQQAPPASAVQPGPIRVPPAAAPPAVVSSAAVIRTLPVDAPVRGGLVPAFRIGPISMTPYGFIKSTAAHDSSMPNGDDFPFPGLFLSSTSALNTGPNKDPEFHLKARSSRAGINIEWPDLSNKLTLTGRVEADFEGNFSEVDNRDISSIRSNAFQLRLAYVRLDYAAGEKTDVFFQGGQDWSIFGSSALPNLLETTFLGAFRGDIYTRSPQMRFGIVQKFGGSRDFKFSPEVAIMMPSSGEIDKLGSQITCPSPVAPATVATCSFVNGLGNQLGQGEREGADSGRPELEARAVFQAKLDKAPGVAPAELIFSGFQSRRESIVTSDAYSFNTALGAPLPANYLAAFPSGFTQSSNQWGGQVALQLPTRWATLVVSAYRGADLRFFFGGQIDADFTDTAGLTNTHTVYQTVDNVAGTASGPMVLGTNSAGQVVVAPQRPVRAFGGFVDLRPAHFTVVQRQSQGTQRRLAARLTRRQGSSGDRDALRSGLPLSFGSMAAATYYKLNNWCTFAFELSIYADHILPELGGLYTIGGVSSRTWLDHREEFGPVFTF